MGIAGNSVPVLVFFIPVFFNGRGETQGLGCSEEKVKITSNMIEKFIVFSKLARLEKSAEKQARLRGFSNLLTAKKMPELTSSLGGIFSPEKRKDLPGYGKGVYKLNTNSRMQRVQWRDFPESKGTETTGSHFRQRKLGEVEGFPRVEGD
jgi:hypothetical protein